ncbi:hypothetical protein T07_8533 [Trichinella nelsoni]|uniref:Uncharacterized protein n=1 Tax=Trichinella nelsoni TaxID=6336 RepID=A0A0V0RJ78_9BILA|nr:hypothetical protein T07_8533 [Trichinella nelsoni]
MYVEETLQCRNFLIHGKESNLLCLHVSTFNSAKYESNYNCYLKMDDGMKLKVKCSPMLNSISASTMLILTSFRSREKQVHAKCPSGALKSSNMYDNSTKQSLLLIGYFSGNAIELYRFGLNPSAGFFVSSFLISIIEVTIYL